MSAARMLQGSVFFFVRVLYSLLFHLCYGVNIYSDWLREQFRNLSLNMLYILCVQEIVFLFQILDALQEMFL